MSAAAVLGVLAACGLLTRTGPPGRLRTDPELGQSVPSVRVVDGVPPKPPGPRPGDRLVQAFSVSERR